MVCRPFDSLVKAANISPSRNIKPLMVTYGPGLHQLIGQNILARIPSLQQDGWVRAKLHSVEIAGIWIENQAATDTILESLRTAASDNVLSIPFAHVLSIVSVADGVSLSESVLDL